MRAFLIAMFLALPNLALATVDKLEVKSLNGKVQHLSELTEKKKLLVIIEQGNQCPVFKRYAPHINDLVSANSGKPVAFILINSFRNAQADAVKAEVESLNLKLPAYLDVDQKVAKHFGLTTLSEVALIDVATSKLLYRGAIDDRVTFYYAKNDAKKPYLQNAINSALAGTEITPSRTQSFGCAITFD